MPVRKASKERLQAFVKESSKYFNWDIILSEAGITEVSDKGEQYEIACPLHTDWSPSMRLTKSNGVYHCFSCGAAGTYTKFMWELGGRSIPYAEFCEQTLRANAAMQASLGFTSLFVNEKTLAPEFQQRRRFNKVSHLGSAMPISTLATKLRAMDDSWETLVLSVSLLQNGMTTDGIYELLRKRHSDVSKVTLAQRMSVMDLLADD